MRKKIVVLQESFLSEKHLSKLKKYGSIEQYRVTKNIEDAKMRLKGASIAVIDSYTFPISAALIDAFPNLEFVCLLSTGSDNVDMPAVKKRNIKISNIPDYATTAVAEHVFALLLSITHRIEKFDRLMRLRPYVLDQTDKSQSQFLGIDLKNKKLGIIGLGRIGKYVACIARGFNMQCIGYDPVVKKTVGVRMMSIKRLLRESDVITLHAPLSLRKPQILTKQKIGLIKQGSILINTARAKLIDEKALYGALRTKKVRAAGLDVLAYKPLLKLPNVVATPHSAWFTKDACEKLGDIVTKNIVAFLSNKPENLI